MSARRGLSALRRAGAAFAGDAAGMSAVEFGMMLPFVAALFVGMAELSHAIDGWRKTTLLARTVSDLTSQGDTQNPISSSLMSDILAASSLVLQPFDATTARIVVSALGVDTTKSTTRPQVCSSTATSNGTARPVGTASDLTIPAGFQTNGVRYLLTEVTMPYTPMLGSALVNLLPGTGGTITITASIPWPVRGGQPYGSNTHTEVVMPGGSPCS